MIQELSECDWVFINAFSKIKSNRLNNLTGELVGRNLDRKLEYIMSKISNRIKKFALFNFDYHLDESLQLSNFDERHLQHANLQEDQDNKLRQISTKTAYGEIHNCISRQRVKGSQSLDLPKIENREERQSFGFSEGSSFAKQNTIQTTNRTVKIKNKNFIELTNFEKFESEKNIALDHKIEKMRNAKLQPNEKDNKRLYFSSSKEMAQSRELSPQINQFKQSRKRVKKNGINYVPIPIGYNGQRIQKKTSKISDAVKYNAHFIDMEISIEPGVTLVGSDGKENWNKKENFRYNIFQKTREKKCNQILNSKNEYNAVFRAPAKKTSDEEKKQEFQRKFQNFVNNFQKEKVQLTFRELMQFKQIVYRKREEEYFLAQQEVCHHQKSLKVLSEESIQKHPVSCKANLTKKQEVSIEHYKNYEEMINAAEQPQEFGKTTTRKRDINIPKIDTMMPQQKRSQHKKLTNTSGKSIIYRKEDSFERRI